MFVFREGNVGAQRDRSFFASGFSLPPQPSCERRWLLLALLAGCWLVAPVSVRVFVLSAVISFAGVAGGHAQAARTADTISPSDIGAVKFVFEATPQDDKVVVLRRDEYINDKLTVRDETIFGLAKLGQPCTQEVLLFDSSFFQSFTNSGNESYYLLKFAGGDTRLADCRLTLSGDAEAGTAKQLVFTSTRKDGSEERRKMVFRILTEPYATLKERYADLPTQEQLRRETISKQTHP